jgi:hypothetical protein
MCFGFAFGSNILMHFEDNFFYSLLLSMAVCGVGFLLLGLRFDLLIGIEGLFSGMMAGMMGCMTSAMLNPEEQFKFLFISVMLLITMVIAYLFIILTNRFPSLLSKYFLMSLLTGAFIVIGYYHFFSEMEVVHLYNHTNQH